MLDDRFNEITEDVEFIYFMDEQLKKSDLTKELIKSKIGQYQLKWDP